MILVVLFAAAASANAAQKNVKLLTGLSDLELQRVMNLMRGSLGVHCDFCHVVTKESGWDFASDAKPEKNRARDMIRMTTELNRTTFAGNATVSCVTCHRGAIQPVTLLPLPQTPPKFPTTRAAAPPPPPSIESRPPAGGARTMKGQRVSWDGKSVAWELVANGDKRYVHAMMPDGPLEQADDGTTAWMRDSKGARAMTTNQRDAFHANLAALEFPLVPADAKQHVLSLDVRDGVPEREVMITRTPIGDMPLQVDYDDYRAAGNTKFPFRIRVAMVDPWSSFTLQLESVDLNAKVDDAIFEMPKEAAK